MIALEDECMPSPSPLPSEEPRVFLDSACLNLTPERPAPPKRVGVGRLRARAGRKEKEEGLITSSAAGERGASGGVEQEAGESREPSVLVLRESASAQNAAITGSVACNGDTSVANSPEGLSLPHVNSSAPLIRRIKDLKQQKSRSPVTGTEQSGSRNHSPASVPSSVSPVLEHLSLPQPLKVGVPSTSCGWSQVTRGMM